MCELLLLISSTLSHWVGLHFR